MRKTGPVPRGRGTQRFERPMAGRDGLTNIVQEGAKTRLGIDNVSEITVARERERLKGIRFATSMVHVKLEKKKKTIYYYSIFFPLSPTELQYVVCFQIMFITLELWSLAHSTISFL